MCCGQTLTVRLYDYSDLSAPDIHRMTDVASLVFDHAGSRINWIHCRGKAATDRRDDRCQSQLESDEINIRLLPLAPNERDPRATVMASAQVQNAGGAHATVFVPAVRALAKDLGVDIDLLLGYAVAHESVHCLLGPMHSQFGLMRARWNRNDAQEMTRIGLGLTKQEACKVAEILVAHSHSNSSR